MQRNYKGEKHGRKDRRDVCVEAARRKWLAGRGERMEGRT